MSADPPFPPPSYILNCHIYHLPAHQSVYLRLLCLRNLPPLPYSQVNATFFDTCNCALLVHNLFLESFLVNLFSVSQERLKQRTQIE